MADARPTRDRTQGQGGWPLAAHDLQGCRQQCVPQVAVMVWARNWPHGIPLASRVK
jgi:hypothetical protein